MGVTNNLLIVSERNARLIKTKKAQCFLRFTTILLKGKPFKFQMWRCLRRIPVLLRKVQWRPPTGRRLSGPRRLSPGPADASGCQPGVGAGPWPRGCTPGCLQVMKAQRNAVSRVFFQKVIKGYFLAFMTLFSFKELHFPTEETELVCVIDRVWVTDKGSFTEKAEDPPDGQVYRVR